MQGEAQQIHVINVAQEVLETKTQGKWSEMMMKPQGPKISTCGVFFFFFSLIPYSELILLPLNEQEFTRIAK